MCGVIGLIHERDRADLGAIAEVLLKTLEYRGYDSTGAAIQRASEEMVDLRKDVGAPSQIVRQLGIDRLAGQILCGQVRWATFGAVDKNNAQPHEVRCKAHIYGAHNGNVTNCDALKVWLTEEGHQVESDNDGEMVVHTVEHAFALRLAALPAPERQSPAARRGAMRLAISEASGQLKGSYAAVIVDPVTHALWAIKQGSSLYFGIGEGEAGRFAIASSDLSAVLKLTRAVVPLSEGDFVELDASTYQVHRLAGGAPIARAPVRSRLRAEDTELRAPFSTFMEQEIHAQVETAQDVIRLFSGGSANLERLLPALDALAAPERAAITRAFDGIREPYSDAAIRSAFSALLGSPGMTAALEKARDDIRSLPEEGVRFFSAEHALFLDLFGRANIADERLAIHFIDASIEQAEVAEFQRAVTAFCEQVTNAADARGRIFILSCGSSFHAAKTAALFFNDIAGVEVLPLLPGELRGQYGQNLRDGDLLIAVSQSGETKDLIDVINLVIGSGRRICRIALVNNLNSTLAQEKADVVVPLHCGPEIAVAATKSFINQLTVFYCLAEEVARMRGARANEALGRRASRDQIPRLIRRTLEETRDPVDVAARQLFLKPSLHILATRLLGVAKEGALKIREVVLNHAEGFEASEFKHGPNTILGFNTTFGLEQVSALATALGQAIAETIRDQESSDPAQIASLVEALASSALTPRSGAGSAAVRALSGDAITRALSADYPLVYVTGPDPRDVDLTVSQINTHKIRGASTIVIAEEDAALRTAATKAPADNPSYHSAYIVLPPAGGALLTAFSATVVLQRLALEMSLLKMAHLDALGLPDHGVHPDVPKNVSKSITVD